MKKHAYPFRLVNVFAPQSADGPFVGNPLCVFEPAPNAPALSTDQMQQLARQFNLSETTFVLPVSAGATADARVRIFAPGYEMRFAGHPTLGTAAVVRDLFGLGASLRLEFLAGIVDVRAGASGHFQFDAPCGPNPPVTPAREPAGLIARLLGLEESDLIGQPLWVDTGTDQLLIRVGSAAAVRKVAPDSALMPQWPLSKLGRKTGYVFFIDESTRAEGKPVQVLARYFFTTTGGGVSEDPGTGSACANLGGWFLAQADKGTAALPLTARVSQGEMVQRLCELSLGITAERTIQVGGRVIELGRGSVSL